MAAGVCALGVLRVVRPVGTPRPLLFGLGEKPKPKDC